MSMPSERVSHDSLSAEESPPGARPAGRQRATDMAPRLATTITLVVLLGFAAVALSYIPESSYSTTGLVEFTGTLALLCTLQLCHSFPHLIERLVPYRYWTLAAQTLLTFLPFAFFHAAWLGMPGLLSASMLLVLPRVFAWPAFGAVAALTGLIQFAVGYRYEQFAYNVVATCLTGLVLYALSRLTELVREVQSARSELAHLAVTQERLRFARDLHDLLGYSLSTITLKCELTLRLMDPQPDRAERELREVLQTARQALSDVRSVASGYRQMNLVPEIAAAESMLNDLGIRTTVRLEEAALPLATDTVLATVLREGITNMLRHSKAQQCVMETTRQGPDLRLRIANDGVGTATSLLTAGEREAGGSGLSNLRTRVAAQGGRLTVGVPAEGWFELVATVPLEAVESGPVPRPVTASPIPARSGSRPRDYVR
ncbi:two-component system, NarL family, sensor histidine kinase DesK [Streptomyces sp. cf386]|uniref:sensor histidine kinase n=1 Tax=Streptomyces sp. cf386 TaxID=1761904 RepID=UPI00088F9CB5|nr:histidine kinase [Streptomyces sp. cf386]SDP00859.1 two-component system, NarL family, sensor histidine kinase DesK [Streptomyces sp. cf386]